MDSYVNQKDIPTKALFDGKEVPSIGLGTFGSGTYGAKEVAQAVKGAIGCGYRMIDCAACYGNEKEIGEVLHEIMETSTVQRNELFIKTKLGNDMHERVEEGCLQSIKDLQCDYLDMLYIHWPVPNLPAENMEDGALNPNSKPFDPEAFVRTYQEIEKLVDKGLVRYIGVSNITKHKIDLVWDRLRIQPAMCQVEMHPCFQQEELFQFLEAKKIVTVGYMPIGSPSRPASDVQEGDVEDIQLPEMKGIAAAHGVHPAIIAIKWAAQRGQIPIPFSVHQEKYFSNLKCITEDPLTEEEMQVITTLEKNNRLGKGQVLLWIGASSWKEMWDEI